MLKTFLCSNIIYNSLSEQADLEALAASLQGVMRVGDEEEDEDEGVEKDRGEKRHTEEEVRNYTCMKCFFWHVTFDFCSCKCADNGELIKN